jgi:SAM-dependent methyltransferase
MSAVSRTVLPRLALPKWLRRSTHHALEREHLPRERYEAAWQARFGNRTQPALGYFTTHRERFYELFNAVAYLRSRYRLGPEVLEIGVSEFTFLYQDLFPELRLVTLDRPIEMNGADAAWSRDHARAERHYNADLTAAKLDPSWGEPPLGRFDLVICTEVIEHLVVNPVEFLEGLVSVLKDEGLLYLTTPNFFRRDNRLKFARGENPQAIYPRRGENWDAHHHFREFGMAELEAFAQQAGGRIVERHYSACWEVDARWPARYAERSNLVLVIGRARSS